MDSKLECIVVMKSETMGNVVKMNGYSNKIDILEGGSVKELKVRDKEEMEEKVNIVVGKFQRMGFKLVNKERYT